MNYIENVVFETGLDPAIINQTSKGKKIVRAMAEALTKDDIWLIKVWAQNKFSLRELVDFLFKNDLDVFDIEYGSITKIYVCRKDDYRIENSVVFSLK